MHEIMEADTDQCHRYLWTLELHLTEDHGKDLLRRDRANMERFHDRLHKEEG